MFRTMKSDLTAYCSRFSGRTARLAAMTLLALGTLAGPATAQIIRDPRVLNPIGGTLTPIGGGTTQPASPALSTPLRVYFSGLTCHDESDDNTFPNPDHDEPYLLVFAADLRNGGAAGRVFVSQEFGDVDNNETRSDLMSIWDLNGNGAPMGGNDYIFLAALMESDNSSNRGAVRRKVSSTLIPKLATYKAAGMSRSTMIGNLRIDMNLAIEASRATYQDEDDRVGGITEIFFADFQLARARAGTAVTETRGFQGSDSRYTLSFRLQ